VALCEGGQPIVSTDGHIDRYPLRTPMIDVRTIGAGGGSIAWVDEGGGLKVGPRSAGARPGPACYGRGGVEPTVTDASVLLGYLSPESFAGGIRLDPELARAAIAERVAAPLRVDLAQAALGMHRIVNANMAQTLRVVSIERGKDPRHFALVAFGGAGPIHAGRLAEESASGPCSCRPAPGVLSALGLLIANVEHEASRTLRANAATVEVDQVNGVLAEVDQVCAERMTRDGIAPAQCQVHHSAEMRYAGQSYELEVPLATPVTREGLGAAVQAFHEAHRRVYAYAKEEAPVEIVTVRAVHASATAERATIDQATPGGAAGAAPARTAHARGVLRRRRRILDVPVHRREHLSPGTELRGPAIVEQPDTTTVIYPGHRAVVDSLGNLVIEVPAVAEARDRQVPTSPGVASLDPVTLEVLRGRLTTIADEMEMVLLKSSYSPLVKEALDATAAIFDRNGKTIAQAEALPAHLGMLTASVQRIARSTTRASRSRATPTS
jgi:N-methylhydantoinase A/oxoprolinase/acetone carboxylase beta subunit